MKVACDVKGTLEGSKKKQVLKLLELFAKAGYEITVWSNLYSYAVDAVRDNNLRADSDQKKGKFDYPYSDDESLHFNFAIEDDRSQTWLAAKQMIWVDQIPEDMAAVELFFRELMGDQ